MEDMYFTDQTEGVLCLNHVHADLRHFSRSGEQRTETSFTSSHLYQAVFSNAGLGDAQNTYTLLFP